MRHYLLIDAGDVIHNMIVWDGTNYDPETKKGWAPPPGMRAVPYEGAWGVGWTWDGKKAVEPPPDAMKVL